MGSDPKRVLIDLEIPIKFLELELLHSEEHLGTVVLTGEAYKVAVEKQETVNAKGIQNNANKSFSDILEWVSGVSVLKTGTGISKPIIQGLYGNRITILNNEVAQSGQRWGNDHSPEIDPLSVEKITVIKGVGALEYPGSHLGGVILTEPKDLAEDLHLHFRASYFLESNGVKNGANFQIGHKGVGGCKPTPKKLSPLSIRMAVAKLEEQTTSKLGIV
ncbi:TonB-dependent receptor [Elysia marginata]|uniref:TonB-dependent receptor n=1 Tax=Elysia marginata TaxID=1093978 RepID=A0AAV4FW40_9GAST|nr:TonB-dependent receptor [Elysia marginata]